MKKIFTLLSFVIHGLVAWGQGGVNSRITGIVMDGNGEKLVNAVVTFYPETDSLKQYPCICDIDGFYSIEVPKGAYQYAVSYMGQQFRELGFRTNAIEDSVKLEPIMLELKGIALDEVEIKANRPFVSYQGSHTVYNLAAHRGARGGSVLDGLRFIPGLHVDGADGLSVFGFYKLTVALNGRVLKLTDDEVKAYLSTLSTADIECVELIRDPGPEYGFQSGAVLNVVTKKNVDEGVNAFLSANLSYRQKISEQATGRVNFNKGKWRNFVAYNFIDKRKKETLLTSMGNDTTVVTPRQSHLLQMGSELRLADAHWVGIRIYGTLSDEKLKNTPNLSVNMDRIGAGANLYHSIGSKSWTWSVNADYAYRNSSRDYWIHDDKTNELSDNFHYLRASTDFWHKFTPTISLQMGGGWTKSDFETQYSEVESEYVENVTSAYVTLRYRKRQIDAYGGIQATYDNWTYRGFSSSSDKDNHFWTWRPYFSIRYDLAQNHRLSANFQTYYQRPNFRDLQSYTSSSSAVFKRKGNPNLNNSTRYNLSLNYVFMRAAMLEINLSTEKNPIVESITPEGDIYYITKINLENSKYLRVLAGAPVPIISKKNGLSWLATTYLAYHWQKDKGVVNGNPYKHHFHAYYVQHKQSLYLPDEWALEVQVTYYSPLTAGLYLTEKQWWTDLTISKRVGDWKFSLMGYDLFNTNVAKGRIAGLDTPVYFSKNWHSPKITLAVNLTIGNKKLKTSNKKDVDADSRLKQSADEGITIGEDE